MDRYVGYGRLGFKRFCCNFNHVINIVLAFFFLSDEPIIDSIPCLRLYYFSFSLGFILGSFYCLDCICFGISLLSYTAGTIQYAQSCTDYFDQFFYRFAINLN